MKKYKDELFQKQKKLDIYIYIYILKIYIDRMLNYKIE